MEKQDLLIKKIDQPVEWFKDVIPNVISNIIRNDHGKRLNINLRRKLINLSAGIPDMVEMTKRLDIYKTGIKIHPKHYPILVKHTEVLKGELLKRPYLYSSQSTSVVSEKERNNKRMEMFDRVIDNSKGKSEVEIQKQMIEVKNRELKLADELLADKIVSKLINHVNLQDVSTQFFQDVLVLGEELAKIDDNLDILPLSQDTYITGEEILYKSSHIGNVLEIKYISADSALTKYSSYFQNETTAKDLLNKYSNAFNFLNSYNTTIDNVLFENGRYGSVLINGYVRETTVIFKAVLKIKLIKTLKNGMLVREVATLNRKVDKSKGETEEVKYIDQWYKCIIIGDDDYVVTEPIRTSFISYGNKIELTKPVVGRFNSSNYAPVTSMYSLAYMFVELYDIVSYLMEDTIAKNLGKLMTIDEATKPRQYSNRQLMEFAREFKIRIINSQGSNTEGFYKMGIPPPSNTTGGYVDMDMSGSIRYYIELLNYLSEQVMDITGINRQRAGSIAPSDLVGNVQRAITQSALSTETQFKMHYAFISELLTVLLHMTKVTPEDILRRIGLVDEEIDYIKNRLDSTMVVKIVNDANDYDISSRIDTLVQNYYAADPRFLPWIVRIMGVSSYRQKMEILNEFYIEQQQQAENTNKAQLQQIQEQFEKAVQEYQAKKSIDLENELQLYLTEHRAELEKLILELDTENELFKEGEENKLRIEKIRKDLQLVLKQMDITAEKNNNKVAKK